MLLDQAILALNADLFACAEGFVDELQRLKASRALLDFNDVEWLAAMR